MAFKIKEYGRSTEVNLLISLHGYPGFFVAWPSRNDRDVVPYGFMSQKNLIFSMPLQFGAGR
jgi:hypothetical protein